MQTDAERFGQKSEPLVTEVEKGAVRRFAEALGETRAMFFDEDSARQQGYRSLVAPPTFAVTLMRMTDVPGVTLPAAGVLHGEQQFEFGVPIVAGDIITATTWAGDMKTREGAQGRMTFLTVMGEGHNQEGEMVFRSQGSLVITEQAGAS